MGMNRRNFFSTVPAAFAAPAATALVLPVPERIEAMETVGDRILIHTANHLFELRERRKNRLKHRPFRLRWLTGPGERS